MRLTEEGPPSPSGSGDFDAVCVERAQQGDRVAFDELYDRHHFRLSRHCARLVGDLQEGEDVAQEAFINAWRSIATLQGDRLFYPWIRRIAENLCHEVWRRRARIEPHADVEPLYRPTVPSSEERALAHLEMQNLEHALGRLNSRHRGVLVQRGSELSYARIARNEGIELSAAKTLIWRARAALRRELDATPSKGLVLLLLPVIRFRSVFRSLFSRASDALVPVTSGAHAASNTFLASSSALVTAGIVAIAPIAVEVSSHHSQPQTPAPILSTPSKAPAGTGSSGGPAVGGPAASQTDHRAGVVAHDPIVVKPAGPAPRRHRHPKRHSSAPTPGASASGSSLVGASGLTNASGAGSSASSTTSSGGSRWDLGPSPANGGFRGNGGNSGNGDGQGDGGGQGGGSTPPEAAFAWGEGGSGSGDQATNSGNSGSISAGSGLTTGGAADGATGTSVVPSGQSSTVLITPRRSAWAYSANDTTTTTTTTTIPASSDSSSADPAANDTATTTTTTIPATSSSSPANVAADDTTTTTTIPASNSSSSATSSRHTGRTGAGQQQVTQPAALSQSATGGTTPAGNSGLSTGASESGGLSSNSGVAPQPWSSAWPGSSGQGGYHRRQ